MEKIKIIDEDLYFDLLRKIKKQELIKLFNDNKISFEELITAKGEFISRSKFKKHLRCFEYVKLALKTYSNTLLHLTDNDIKKIGNDKVFCLIEELMKNNEWNLGGIPSSFQTKEIIFKALEKDPYNFIYIRNDFNNEYEVQKIYFGYVQN